MNKANKNNKAKYMCLLCIQLHKEPPAVMASVGEKRSGRTDPVFKKHQKVAPSTQDIALFFYSSTRTVSP